MLFRCLRSGNTVNIIQQDDIDRMMNFEGYEPVKEIQHEQHEQHETNADETVQIPQTPEAEVLTVAKKRGRPRNEVRAAEFVGEI
jgi:hypothetical protein